MFYSDIFFSQNTETNNGNQGFVFLQKKFQKVETKDGNQGFFFNKSCCHV